MTMDKNFIKERINYIRTANKISARNLSLELGMSSEYINQLEGGRLTPSVDFIINFCDYFKISLSEFFDEGKKYPLEYKELIENLNKLNREELKVISDVAQMIARNKK